MPEFSLYKIGSRSGISYYVARDEVHAVELFKKLGDNQSPAFTVEGLGLLGKDVFLGFEPTQSTPDRSMHLNIMVRCLLRLADGNPLAYEALRSACALFPDHPLLQPPATRPLLGNSAGKTYPGAPTPPGPLQHTTSCGAFKSWKPEDCTCVSPTPPLEPLTPPDTMA